MLKEINIISIGKIAKMYENTVLYYQKLIKLPITFNNILYKKTILPKEIKQFEARLIDKTLDPNAYLIVLNCIGDSYDSSTFTKMIIQHLENTKKIQFVIGGAFGLDEKIIDKANKKLSLSKLTLTHQLTKVLLLEQIYRSQSTLTSHPYNK